jgi:TolA-binding protein
MQPGRLMFTAALALGLAAAPASADDAAPAAPGGYEDAVDRDHAELDRFQSWIREQVDTLEQEIGELRQELEESEPAARERIEAMIRQAQEAAISLREEARRIGDASAEQWESAKASALSGWHRVRAAYYAALAELRGEGEDR